MSVRRIVNGAPVNDSERAAFELLESELAKRPESYGLCTNIMLADQRNRMIEIDAIVVAPSMIFVIEIKGWRGRITLQRDRWFLDDGSVRPNPGELLSRKAKELKTLLERHDRNRLAKRNLWMQELLYVNGPGAQLADYDYERRTSYNVAPFAFTERGMLLDAILKPGRWAQVREFDERELEAIDEFLRGGKERPERDRIAQYVIEQQLAPTSDRFERVLARNPLESAADELVELHVYPLDKTKATREKTVELLRRQVETVKTLSKIGVSPAFRAAFEVDDDRHPAFVVAYESLAKAQPFRDLLEPPHPLGLKETLKYGVGLAEALAKIHEQGVIHGALEPGAIALRRPYDPASFVISRIELARSLKPEGYSLLPASTVGAITNLYASPAVVQGVRPGERDDVYSFGALFAHLVFGQPLFKSAAATLRGVRLPPIASGEDSVTAALRTLLAELLAREESQRLPSMRLALERIDALARSVAGNREQYERIGDYEVVRELRAGATGRTVVARRRNQAGELVLKIATNGSAAVDPLIAEVELLLTLRHKNIVTARGLVELSIGVAGEFDYLAGPDLARLRGRVSPEQARALVHGLFSALAAVHRAGYVHRDVKPANVVLTSEKAVLLDFGLAARKGNAQTEVGTAPYKSRALIERGKWLPQDDVFAAALTVWEALGGKHPWNMGEPNGPPELNAADLGSALDAESAKRFTVVITQILNEPKTASQARVALLEALGVNVSAAPRLPLGPAVSLPETASLNDEIAMLKLSTPAREALAERGAQTLDDVRRLRTSDLLRIRTVSRAAVDEVEGLVLLLTERFGDPPEPHESRSSLPAPLLGFAPVLADESLGIEVLGLPSSIVEGLRALGRQTVGEVAILRPTTVQDLPALGPAAEIAIRDALERLVDDRQAVVVDAALPPHRLDAKGDFEAAVVALGAAQGAAIDALEVAGGDVLRASEITGLASDIVFAPPWTREDATAFVAAVQMAVAFPPKNADAIAREVVDALAPTTRERLAPLGESALTDAARIVLRAATGTARVERDNGSDFWFAPAAVPAADALAFAAERLAMPLAPAALLTRVRQALPGVVLPAVGTPEFGAALAVAGFAYTEVGLIDRADARTPEAEPEPSIVEDIDRSPIEAAAESILATRRIASFRLIVTEPAHHAKLSRQLVAALSARIDADRVRAIDVDAALCDALEREGTLAAALRRDARGLTIGDLEALAGDAARTILDDAIAGDDPESVTVLYNTGGLAHTQAPGYLRSVYDRARGGGPAGLILVCIPGDHPREHARLNREIPLVVTGTETPLYLEATA